MNEQEITEGHGRTDISCYHGSRWIWWVPPNTDGEWMQVVIAPDCNHIDPPRPFKEEQST